MTGETAVDITRNDEYGTFTRLLLDRAQALGDTTAHVFVRDTGAATAAEHLTYGELDRAARTLALRLHERGAQGRPVLLLHPPGPDFLKAFAGCLYAGAVAVPAPLPGDRGERLQRVPASSRTPAPSSSLTDSPTPPTCRCGSPPRAAATSCAWPPTSTRTTAPTTGGRPPPAPTTWRSCSTPPGSTSQPRASWSATATSSPTRRRCAAPSAHSGRPVRRLAAPLPRHGPHRAISCTRCWLGSASVHHGPERLHQTPRPLAADDREYGVTHRRRPQLRLRPVRARITDEQVAGLDLSRWRRPSTAPNRYAPETLEASPRRSPPPASTPPPSTPATGSPKPPSWCPAAPRPPLRPAHRRPAVALEHDRAARPRTPDRRPYPGRLAAAPTASTLRIVDPVDGRELPAGRSARSGCAATAWPRATGNPRPDGRRLPRGPPAAATAAICAPGTSASCDGGELTSPGG